MKMMGDNIAVQLIEEEVVTKTQSGIILPDSISNVEYVLAVVVHPDKDGELKEGDVLGLIKHADFIEYKDVLIIGKSHNILFVQ